MPISQNVTFSGSCEKSAEYDHPAGYTLIELLGSAARDNGWNVAAPENWRDSGWSLMLTRTGSELEVVLSEMGSEEWMMQIAPSKVPTLGLLSRLFGNKKVEPPSASPTDCYDVSVVLDNFLQHSNYKDMRWCWDNFPDKSNGTETPQRANET